MSNCVTSCALYGMIRKGGGRLLICEDALSMAQRRRIVAWEAIYCPPVASGAGAVEHE